MLKLIAFKKINPYYVAFLFILFMKPLSASHVFTTTVLGWDNRFTILDVKQKRQRPKFILIPYFEFYGGTIVHYKNLQFSIAPGIKIKKNTATNVNTARFFFFKGSIQYFGETFSLGLGKDHYVYGEGYSYRFAFPYFPLERDNFQFPKNENLWNAHLDWFVNAVSISVGSFFDSKQIDLFKSPQWFSLWTNISYNHKIFSLLASLDYHYQTPSKDNTVKAAIEAKLVLAKDEHSFSLYNTFASFFLLKNINPQSQDRFQNLLGILYVLQKNKLGLSLGTEAFYKNHFGYVLYSVITLFDIFQIHLHWVHNIKHQANISTEFSVLTQGWKFSFLYVSRNLLKESFVKNNFTFQISYKL